VGDGLKTFFWKDTWVDSVPLMVSFPRLFSLSSSQEAMVGELGGGRWRFSWQRELYVWEICGL